jgi:hypothetical protein
LCVSANGAQLAPAAAAVSRNRRRSSLQDSDFLRKAAQHNNNTCLVRSQREARLHLASSHRPRPIPPSTTTSHHQHLPAQFRHSSAFSVPLRRLTHTYHLHALPSLPTNCYKHPPTLSTRDELTAATLAGWQRTTIASLTSFGRTACETASLNTSHIITSTSNTSLHPSRHRQPLHFHTTCLSVTTRTSSCSSCVSRRL